MRLPVLAAALGLALPILLEAAPARADSFLDLVGGISIPVGDSDWTDQVESSPKLAVRAGSIPDNVGAFVSADWTPENTDFKAQFPNADVSAHRFRLLAGVAFQSPQKANLILTGRAGIGADIAHASVNNTILGDFSDTDTGFAFEMGVGLWVKLGSVAVGGEVALPISHHDHAASQNGIEFKYTSFDVDLMFGVRLMAK